MEIDLAEAAPSLGRMARGPLCIVGGGIAGLLLADTLATAGVDVLLLEGGGPSPEHAQRRLAAEVDLLGQPHLGTRDGRTWALGGNSTTWGGQLLPLPADAGWPVCSEDLRPFLPAVEHLLGVDDLPYDAARFWRRSHSSAPAALPGPAAGLELALSKFTPFTHRDLRRSLGARLREHPRARVATRGRAVELLWSDDRTRVAAVLVQVHGGQLLPLPVSACILAAGTVETCRLLLLSATKAGGATWTFSVGRNFHDHLTVEVAVARAAARHAALTCRPWIEGGLLGTAHSLKLIAGPALRGRLCLAPSLAHWTVTEPEEAGLGALRHALRTRQGHGEETPWTATLRAADAAGSLARLYTEAAFTGRRYVSAQATVALRLNVAQHTPSPSRVRLSGARDKAGQLRAEIAWHLAPEDLASLARFAAFLQTTLGSEGLDEAAGLHWHSEVIQALQAGLPPPGLDDARHAMGGACMSVDPLQGVVDRNLRVHGVQNLYLASAAVFPDGSPHLPTLTLMALTLRLAGHLRQELPL